MATMKMLFDRVSDADILRELFLEYPEEVSSTRGYRKALDEIRSLDPVVSDITICAELVNDPLDEEIYVDVFGRKPNDSDPYAVEFMRWEEWLGSFVDTGDFSDAQFLAHCLFEMTFVGYSNAEVHKELENISDMAHDATERLENGEEFPDALDNV